MRPRGTSISSMAISDLSSASVAGGLGDGGDVVRHVGPDRARCGPRPRVGDVEDAVDAGGAFVAAAASSEAGALLPWRRRAPEPVTRRGRV